MAAGFRDVLHLTGVLPLGSGFPSAIKPLAKYAGTTFDIGIAPSLEAVAEHPFTPYAATTFDIPEGESTIVGD